MADLVDGVRQFIAERDLLSPGDSVLLAVSGGLDSMVLLRVMAQLAPAQGWRLNVAHFNHCLRGRSSDLDEVLVCDAAKSMGLRFKAGRADVRKFSRTQGISIETAARQLRHRFLARVASSLGIEKIALAHHADDQVELFFLRLLRGAGPEGLAGMRAIGPSPADAGLKLIRPLLPLFRSELETFAHEKGIRFRSDASNRKIEFARNRVRLELLPYLRTHFQPAIRQTTLRLVEILAAESDWIEQMTEQTPSDRPLESLPVALQRRRLQRECLRLGVVPDFALIERLRCVSEQECMVSPGRVVQRDRAGRLTLKRVAALQFNADRRSVRISTGPSQLAYSGLLFSWRIMACSGKSLPPRSPGYECFDADRIGRAVGLRHWQPGDRFQPIGMPGPVKLQDLFTNLKIHPEQRRQLVLAETSQKEIFWVEGLRISERFKLRAATTRCLEWSWEREAPPFLA